MTPSLVDTQLLDASLLPRPVIREVSSASSRPTARSASGVTVRIRDLRKRFGAREVLKGVSLTIRPGEFLAIVGQSGCGKSTLLRLLAGLDQPSDGQIAIDNELAVGVASSRLLFQDARLLPWRRVLNNVGIGLSGDWRDTAFAALRAVGLEDRHRDWPAILSGGQRQRVALARALVSQPKLLLLDEPLGALDALTRLEMQALIESVWREQKFTAVLVTHDVSEAVALADRVIVLADGEVAREITIPQPRPRLRGNAELAALEARLLDVLLTRSPLATEPTRPRNAAVGG